MNVFRRRELKFILNARQRRDIEALLERRMVPDAYGNSTICSLYYDTPDFRLIRHSLEKPVYKEKLRLRSYGPIVDGTDVFLEMKKKYKGVVYKRRVAVSQQEAMAFMAFEAPLPRDSQIGRELTWFRDFYRTLEPRVYLCYDRQAWYDPVDKGFRVTLDENVRFRTEALDLSVPPSGRFVLEPESYLLEVKASGGVPLWLTEHLSKAGIYKQSFSKYGRAYQILLGTSKNSLSTKCPIFRPNFCL